MAVPEAKTRTETESDEQPESAAAPPRKRFGKKILLMAGGGALALLLGLGGAAWFFLFSGSGDTQQKEAALPALPLVPPQVAYYEVPDILVNIESADGSPAYLKLSVALELASGEEKPGIQALMPRIVDQFQAYLRELRVDDLRGSAGIARLKEELLRRIDVAAAPYPVRDVLLKQMIVQ